jgi:Na+-transporting NADH:ubiquinone oxidoreductase subunit F
MNSERDYGDILERWYTSNVDRSELVKLMQRSNLKGIIQLLCHVALMIVFAYLAYLSIGTIWMIFPFFAYGTLYCFLNHVMHETHHRTPFKWNWLNETVHWITAFTHGAEPIFDRWGHARHHTYTYFPDMDPESIGPRPVKLSNFFLPFIGFGIIKPLPIMKHALGIIDDYSKDLVPETDWNKMIWSSRFWILGYVLIIASCLYFHTFLPLVYTLFARFYGAFIPTMLNQTQHVGLEQNVYDHRLITRNVMVNPVLGFIYWNMQYHTEHHMFPGVPFYALSSLHKLVKDQLPPPYKSVFAAYREILPTVFKQQKEPDFHITPVIPQKSEDSEISQTEDNDKKLKVQEIIEEKIKWVPVGSLDSLAVNDVVSFQYKDKQYAVYRLKDGYFASEGKCTHSGAILAKGLVIDELIECPAHQGRFDIRTGEATHSPACDKLENYPVRINDNYIFIGLPI